MAGTALTLPALSDNLALYYREVGQFELLTPEKEQELARRWFDEGDVQAAHQLVVSNLRFVVKIALEYRRYGVRTLDLIQEGNVGLMRAVKKFDPYKGFRLISYAVWWIRAQIHDYILKSWSLVKIGTTRMQRKLFNRLQSAQRRLKGQLAAADSDAVDDRLLAEELDVPQEEVAQFRQRVRQKDVSIDVPVHDDGNTMMRDRLSDESLNQEDSLAAVQAQERLRRRVAEAVETLDERDRYIVQSRLLADKALTLQAIGDHFGVSKERARQLEVRVKARLREHLSDFGDVAFA